jgi:hypothetical protein
MHAPRQALFKLGQPFFERLDGVGDRIGDLSQGARIMVRRIIGERCGGLIAGAVANSRFEIG